MPADASPMLPPLPTFLEDEKVCGNCKLWQAHSVDHRGWVGPCRLQPSRGLFPPTAPICDYFAPKGAPSALPPPRESAPHRPLRNIAPLVVKRERQKGAAVDLGGELNMTRDELMEI